MSEQIVKPISTFLVINGRSVAYRHFRRFQRILARSYRGSQIPVASSYLNLVWFQYPSRSFACSSMRHQDRFHRPQPCPRRCQGYLLPGPFESLEMPGVLVSYRNPFVQLLNLNFVPSETGESSPATQASLNEEGEYEERNCICIEYIASCQYSFCITFFHHILGR